MLLSLLISISVNILSILLLVKLILGLRKYQPYKEIVNIDEHVATKNRELSNIDTAINNLNSDYARQRSELSENYQNKKNIYENLLNEISELEGKVELISYGVYEPCFNLEDSEEYKKKLKQTIDSQKDFIKHHRAIKCLVEWQVGGSKSQGRKLTTQYSNLMLRAFNGECDGIVSKVRWSNVKSMEARIKQAFKVINQCGSTYSIIITHEYLDLKLQQLNLEYELQEKKHEEKEKQRKIREQMREEEKAQRDFEKARTEAAKEEEKYQSALEEAKKQIALGREKDINGLNEKISLLESKLAMAQEQKQRAISRAQQTKSGHVYVISNCGSFGENTYKIGMTRRLDPLDRIFELGDASVPFGFDVHALIYSENAPELENALHKKLEINRTNLVNLRREFFNTSLDEIEAIIRDLKLECEVIKLAEAKEFRVTQSIRHMKTNEHKDQAQTEVKFPSSLE